MACSGGIITAGALPHLAGDEVASLTLLVCALDNARAGTASALASREVAAAAVAESARRGYLDGRALAGVFAWLRPNDLIWGYVVNNYLLGRRPPAFDVLYWTQDTVRLAAGLHGDFVRIGLENSLTRAGGVEVLGRPVDLKACTVDTYAVAGRSDHLVPSGERVPERAAARWRHAVRARDERPHPGAREPAEGREPRELPRRHGACRLAGERRRPPRQLVAGLVGLARGAVGRAQAGPREARQPHPRGAAASAGELCPRGPERWWGRPLAESRWALELARLSVDPVLLGRGVARGDGRPVVLLPGFLAGDPSLLVLASWLRRIGHRPYGCGFVANVDCSDPRARARRAARRAAPPPSRPARRAGRAQPRRALRPARSRTAAPSTVWPVPPVSLGADLQRMFGISVPTQVAVIAARRGVAALRRGRAERCLYADCTCSFARDFACPLPEGVRFTSVYSKGDGVVHWPGSVIAVADNVEVTGSHVGLIFNRKAYRAIADALALPEIT